jgi:ubiquinone/menaquinone biosynthesis C-methylase UbiE
MSFAQDVRVLAALVRGATRRADSQSERMDSFYADQAEYYDEFRKRLLPGRAELLAELDFQDGDRVLDLGGGTGANLEFLPDSVHRQLRDWTIVDLSSPLLAIARRRVKQRGWQHVKVVEADACQYQPPAPVDVLLFSYSLTMIPAWEAVLDHALSLLKPGGLVAVVDFTVSASAPGPGLVRHGWFTRTFWPRWFAWDSVYLSPEHLPALLVRCKPVSLYQGLTRLPYVPGSRVPYFRFIGRKP